MTSLLTCRNWDGAAQRRIDREFSGRAPAPPAGGADSKDNPGEAALW